MPSIRLKNISKSFPSNIAALNNLSLEIYNGEMLVITGPSGCGKSTLLRLIAGLEDPDRGDVFINDQLATFIDPTERNIAIVNQNRIMYPNLSVYGNLEFGLKFRKLNSKHIRDRIGQIANQLEISDLLDKHSGDLNIFEKQRVAFARAAVKMPRVILVDQVSTAYDETTRKALYEEIALLHNKLHITTVLAIDSDTAPVKMGDRTAIMNKGAVEQAGTYEKLYENPANQFVAEFMGRGSEIVDS
jgi:ABC-type sugar transport system ATPase subunit